MKGNTRMPAVPKLLAVPSRSLMDAGGVAKRAVPRGKDANRRMVLVVAVEAGLHARDRCLPDGMGELGVAAGALQTASKMNVVLEPQNRIGEASLRLTVAGSTL